MFRPGQDLPPFLPGGLPPRAPSPGMMNIGPPQYTPPPLPGRAFVLSPFAGHSRFPPPPPLPMPSGQLLQPSMHPSVQPPQPRMQPPQPPMLPPPPPVRSSIQVPQPFIPPPQPPLQPPQPPHFIPPLPGTPPDEVPPPPPSGPPSPPPLPPAGGSDQSPVTPPRMPSDPEMVKNIEVLAAFVVKNGPEFELMARAKQAGNPKFAFLFGNDPGTEAAVGHAYYNWKKQILESQMQQEAESKASIRLKVGKTSESVPLVNNLAGKSVTPKEVPGSPTVSDMDMEEEDDFALPSPRKETGGERQLEECKSVSKEDFREPTAIRMETDDRDECQLNEPRDVSDEGSRKVTADRVVVVDLQLPYSEEEDSGEDQSKEPGAEFELGTDDDFSTPPPKEDTSGERRLQEPTPVPEDDIRESIADRMEADAFVLVSPKEESSIEMQFKEPKAIPEETIREDIRESMANRMETDASALASPKEELSVERQFKEPEVGSDEGIREYIRESIVDRMGDSLLRTSRWGPPQPVDGVILPSEKVELDDRGDPIDASEKRQKFPSEKVELDDRGDPIDASEKRQKFGDSISSPDVSFNERSDYLKDWDRRATVDKFRERDFDRRRSRADYRQQQDQGGVAVDEFGRIKREGSDESDFDEDPHKLIRRRSYSRSRSRSWSPGESRWRRRGVSRSPRRWGRRSRSHSRSPRWRRSHSRTPPRDSRWAPLGRGDHEFPERGRRGGRGPVQHVCFDFIRGKCFRGASCRYLHQENLGGAGDSSGRRASGIHNRGWRETGVDHQRSWTARSITPPVAVVEAVVEAVANEEKISTKDVEAASEPQDGSELRHQNLTPEEGKHDETSRLDGNDSEKPAKATETMDEDPNACDKVDVLGKPSSPPSLSPDSGSSPQKPTLLETPLSLDQPLPIVTSGSSLPLPLVTVQPSPASVQETATISQHASSGNSTLQSPRVSLPSPRIATLNMQHSFSMGRPVATGTSLLLQPVSIHQSNFPFENLRLFQPPHQIFAMGNPAFSQPPPFSGNSLPPRPPFVTNHRPPIQPGYQASIPSQLGIGTNLPQQYMPGPNLAVPQQHMPGPNLTVPQQHMPGPNLAVPQQHMPGLNLGAPQQHMPGLNLGAPQQHMPGPHLSVPQQHMPGPHLSVPQQHMPGPNLAAPQQHMPGPNLAVPQQHIPGPNLAVLQQHNFPITNHPTSLLGHEPRFQQRGIAPTVTTTTMSVQHGFSSFPEQVLNSLPEHSNPSHERGFNPLFEQRFKSYPEQGFNPFPERGFNPFPERSFNPPPEQGFKTVPERGFNPLPEQGLNPIPEQRFNHHPEWGFNPLPEQRFNPLPERGFNPLPEQGFKSLPERGFNSFPEQGFKSLPERGFNSLPEQGFNSVPERGFSSLISERGLNSLPEQGFGSMPGASMQPSFTRPFIGDASSQFTFPHHARTVEQNGMLNIPPITMDSPTGQIPPSAAMLWMVPAPGSLGTHAALAQPLPVPRPAQAPSLNYSLPGVSAVTGLLQMQPKALAKNIAAGEQYDPLADSIEREPSGGLLAWTKPSLTDGYVTDKSRPVVLQSIALAPTFESLSPQSIEKLEAISLKVPVGLASNNVTAKLVRADETAAIGVGVVENVSPPDDNRNWSPGQPVEGATGTGEVETSQEQVRVKSKKNKEGRGLKLLRAAVAEYVKEVLKPTWREGQMSKEAFKTIAKKAVEKVTGNIASHHIPKSQEKVDHYMSSSRSKIAKLVQGYVDKYLKT